MSNKTIVLLGGLIACGLVIWGIVHGVSDGVPVEAAAVKVGPINEFVDERGITRLPQTHLITMPVAGRIEKIALTEGAKVAQGQIVAQIVPRDLELAVAEATAARDRLVAGVAENDDVILEQTTKTQAQFFVDSMEETVKAAAARVEAGLAKYQYASNDYNRVEALVPSGSRTRDDLEQASLRKVEARVDYQQDMLVHTAMVAMQAATGLMPRMVQEYIDRKTIRTKEVLVHQKTEAEIHLQKILQDQDRGRMVSPVDGVVLERSISNERFLAAGDTLLEIGRLEDLQIETDLLSLDVVDAEEGDPVEIYGPAIGLPAARGTVERIYPAGFTKVSSLGVEQQRVKVVIRFDPADLTRLRQERNLGVGYRVRVKITTAEKPDALVIPRSSLFRGANGDWQVYAIRAGRAIVQSVEVGLLNDARAEITKGLAENERVVLAPESNLTDGARVKVQ